MKEAKEIITKFHEFQARRTEAEKHRREKPTPENFFWLMNQLRNIDRFGTPTEFVVQDPNYFVQTSCLTYDLPKSIGWITEKHVRIHQPIDVDGYEAVTIFSMHEKHVNPNDSDIFVITSIHETVDHKPLKLRPVTSFVYALISREKSRKFTGGNLEISAANHSKIVDNAYGLALQAITKRHFTSKVEILKPGVIQLPFQPRLI